MLASADDARGGTWARGEAERGRVIGEARGDDGRSAAAGPSSSPREFDRAGIMGLLPHRDPMLLLEWIPWLEPGVRAVAVAADLSRRAPAIPRERGGEVPPELLIEGIAQTAAAILVAEGVADGRYPPGEPQPGVLAAVPECRFPARAAAGAAITFRVEVVKRLGRLVMLRGEAFAGASLVAEGMVSIALGKPGG